MPKFYVQSGDLKMVLQARDNRCAAIWAAHCTLSRTLPFLCEEPADYSRLTDLTQLGESIRRYCVPGSLPIHSSECCGGSYMSWWLVSPPMRSLSAPVRLPAR